MICISRENSDFSFISHDSVLKLNDIRTLSVNRILYQQHEVISLSSDTYKKIEELVLRKYFPSFMYEYIQMGQKLSDTEAILNEKEEILRALKIESEEWKKQIEELETRIANTDNKQQSTGLLQK